MVVAVAGGALGSGARENRPVQLVKTGNAEDNYSFTLCSENLDRVLAKVPEGMEVSVVSVVGAFRTGKSFLLSFFIRFLNSGSLDDTSDAWMTADGPSLREGNRNVVSATSVGNGERGFGDETMRSFEWRGGAERMTTGIWMWSEPFVRRTECGKEVAVLLVDTQGMFDNETSMGLTACIFAVSTLLSSCQIYNVEKRIQEDNLQQLALFAEYGRMALNKEQEMADAASSGIIEDVDDMTAGTSAKKPGKQGSGMGVEKLGSPALKGTTPVGASAVGFAAKARTGIEARARNIASGGDASGGGSSLKEGNGVMTHGAAEGASGKADVSKDRVERPFQRLEFLVRDWQNYDDEDMPVENLQEEMNGYLMDVISDKGVKDLRDTREQISSCFEKISCFGMTHPGFEVVKKSYGGEISKIQPSFLRLLNTYARHIFADLEPKRVNGRFLTAPELRNYASAYVELFHNGAHFPAARSLLEATAGAHNGNAKHVAVLRYKAEMDMVVGPKATSFLAKAMFSEHEGLCREGAMRVFDAMATMGRRSEIMRVRLLLLEELEDAKTRYLDANASRNPLRGSEYWVIPMSIAFVSYIARWIADSSCSAWSTTCRRTSDTLGFMYSAMVVVLLVMFRQRVKLMAEHLFNLLPIVADRMQQA